MIADVFGGPYEDIPTVFTVHGFEILNLATVGVYGRISGRR